MEQHYTIISSIMEDNELESLITLKPQNLIQTSILAEHRNKQSEPNKYSTKETKTKPRYC